MASRNITTVFTVKGENEYKKKISDINRSLKTMRSEMKLTDKAFAGNDESLEALGQKYDILKRTYETQQKKVEEIESALKYSEDALAGFVSRGEDLTSQLASLSDKINSIKDSGEDSLGEMEELLKQKETLERNLKGNTESEEKFRMFSDNWQTQLNNAKSDLLDTSALSTTPPIPWTKPEKRLTNSETERKARERTPKRWRRRRTLLSKPLLQWRRLSDLRRYFRGLAVR